MLSQVPNSWCLETRSRKETQANLQEQLHWSNPERIAFVAGVSLRSVKLNLLFDMQILFTVVLLIIPNYGNIHNCLGRIVGRSDAKWYLSASCPFS